MSKKKFKPTGNEKTLTEIAEIVEQLPALRELKITNDDQFNEARADYKMLRESESKLLTKKKAILDPLNTAISELKTLFKPAETRILAIIDAYALELGRYANAREIARLKALEQVNNDKRIKSIETLQDRREEIGDRLSGTMKVRRLIIDDPGKIPNEFWIINEDALKKAIIGGREIKGAKVVEELVVTAR